MKVKFAKWPAGFAMLKEDMTLDARATAFGSQGNVLSFDRFQPTSGGPLPAVIHLLWDQAVELEVRISFKYDIVFSKNNAAGGGQGQYDLAQYWRISYADDGIQLHTGNVRDFGGASGDGSFAVQVQLGPDQSPSPADTTFVTLLVRLVGGLVSDGINVGYGPISATIGKSDVRLTTDIPLRVECHAKSKPEKKVPIAIPSHLLNFPVHFEEERQRHLSAPQLSRLSDSWAKPLQKEAPELASAMATGLCPVVLIGHASTTGKRDYNLILSTDRILSVMSAIRTNFPKDKQRFVFLPIPKGKDAATQTGPVVNEHRVEIEIDPQMATTAIKAARALARP